MLQMSLCLVGLSEHVWCVVYVNAFAGEMRIPHFLEIHCRVDTGRIIYERAQWDVGLLDAVPRLNDTLARAELTALWKTYRRCLQELKTSGELLEATMEVLQKHFASQFAVTAPLSPAPLITVEGIIEAMSAWVSRVPDIEIALRGVVHVSSTRLIARYCLSGHPAAQATKDTKEWEVQGHDVVDFDAAGKIVKIRAYYDPGPLVSLSSSAGIMRPLHPDKKEL